MTQAVVPSLTREAARALTDKIQHLAADLWETVQKAWEGRAWEALDYGSWQDYCATEFDSAHLALPKAERARVVAMLSDAGMSQRAIAAATNTARNTVASDLAQIEPPGPRDERPETPYAPASRPASVPSDESDEEIDQMITVLVRNVRRFAGACTSEECTRLKAAMKPALDRLDKKIQRQGK